MYQNGGQPIDPTGINIPYKSMLNTLTIQKEAEKDVMENLYVC